jgi:urease accessory protein
MSADRLALLQLCDSLFPVGSFAHSDGLEAAVADSRIKSAGDLVSWLEAQLHVTLARADGPGLRCAMRALADDDLDAIAVVDDELFAMRPSSAGRSATRTQGDRLLRTWQHIRPSTRLATAMAARAHHTFPVAFGLVCGASGLTVLDALEGFFYTRLAAGVSAAMRLMPLGQHEAHRLLAEILREVPACAASVAADHAPPRAFAPHMDIASMRHQYVHSRLFRS